VFSHQALRAQEGGKEAAAREPARQAAIISSTLPTLEPVHTSTFCLQVKLEGPHTGPKGPPSGLEDPVLYLILA
jgi:hypothetical protein